MTECCEKCKYVAQIVHMFANDNMLHCDCCCTLLAEDGLILPTEPNYRCEDFTPKENET